jgi:hypothetical protein
VLTETRVTTALERLAEQRVSGVLEIDGNPAGTIYLNQGQITFARASWIPDLSARLPRVLVPSVASPDLIAEPDRPDRDIGTELVQRQFLSRPDLQAILRSIVVDAALVLMVPFDRDAFVSDVRFAAPGAHWAGAFSSLGVDSVLAEASKMAERVARYNLARTKPLQLCDLGGPSAVLSREQWAVACAIDGTRSVQDLAWHCGLALYDAMERVGGLVQAGVCAPCAPAPAPGALDQWFGRDDPGPAALPVLSPDQAISPTPVLAPMPRRSPRAAPSPRPAPSARPVPPVRPAPPPTPVLSPTAVLPPSQVGSRLPHRGPTVAQPTRPMMSAPVWVAGAEPPGDFAAAQPDLLRRVLDGLRKLS